MALRLSLIFRVTSDQVVQCFMLGHHLNHKGDQLFVVGEKAEKLLIAITVHENVVKGQTNALYKFKCVM